jgi:hypothetical protein
MIKIRKDQFETFEKKAQLDFEDELVGHLKTFSPKHAQGVGDEGLKKLVQTGLSQARAYGWKLRGSLRFFVECQMMFGYRFDSDPIFPWASKYFGSTQDLSNELKWADQIHETVMKYRSEVVGFKEKIEAVAIRKLIGTPVNEWLSGDLSESATEKMLAETYPEKIQRAPKGATAILIRKSHDLAIANQLPSGSGTRAISALMLAFGHGVLTDPQFPWIAENLKSSEAMPGEKRVEKLGIRAFAYLSDGLTEMG